MAMDPISQLFMQARGGLAGGEGFGNYAVQGAQLANQRRGQQLQERQIGLEQQRIGQEEQRIGLANRRMQLEETELAQKKELFPFLLEAAETKRAMDTLTLELERNKLKRSLNATAGEGAAGRIMLQVADEGFSPRVIGEIQTLNSRDPAALWASEAGKTLMENFNAHVKGQLTLRAMQNALGAGGGGVDVNGIPVGDGVGAGGATRVTQTFRNPVTGQTTAVTADPVAAERNRLSQQNYDLAKAKFEKQQADDLAELSPVERALYDQFVGAVTKNAYMVGKPLATQQAEILKAHATFMRQLGKGSGAGASTGTAPKGDVVNPNDPMKLRE